jgi:hypothetical protein
LWERSQPRQRQPPRQPHSVVSKHTFAHRAITSICGAPPALILI